MTFELSVKFCRISNVLYCVQMADEIVKGCEMALPDGQASRQMSEAAYLEFERESDTRHEFMNGQVIAMIGASQSHNRITVNLIRLFGNAFQDGMCEVYGSDMRVKIPPGNYVYPDVSLVCGDAQLDDSAFATLINPLVIIEVLSPSTEAYDRGEKFRQYRQLTTLREYVLIAQDSPRIERYWRQPDDIWSFKDVAGLESRIMLDAVDVVLSLQAVYERVVFPADSSDG
jgi:Uma2 family endonuclease